MEHAYLLRILLFCVLQATAWGQEMCGISYRNMTVAFNSTTTLLTCNIADPTTTTTTRWWFSNDPCGPFTQSTLCPEGSSACPNFDVSQAEDRFYHCCTRGEAVQDTSDRDCVHVQICASLATRYVTPIAVYGATLRLYVDVYANPRPQDSATVFIHSTDITNTTQVSVYQRSQLTPILTFEYTIPVPLFDQSMIDSTNPEDRILVFTVSFNPKCPGDQSTNIAESIPVLSNGGGVSTPSATPTVQPTTEGIGSLDQCSMNHGLLAAFVVIVVIVVLMGVALLGCLVHFKRKLKSTSTLAPSVISDSADTSRPNTLDVSQYSRLTQQHTTPSPAIPHVNCPPGVQPHPPHSNGTHPLSAQQTSNSTTPTRPSTTPSSLTVAVGVTRAHTGHTPLMTFTPGGPGQPFPDPNAGQPSPPAYSELCEVINGAHATMVVSEEVPVSPYATAVVGGAAGSGVSTSGGGGGGGGANGEPIYNTATIDGLASGVELAGVHPATDV